MTLKLKHTLLIAPTMIFLGCEADKTPLQGKREDFITARSPLTVNKSFKKAVTLTKDQVNAEWAQNGGNAEHNIGVLSLGKDLNKKWEHNIGYGSSSGQKLISNAVADKNAIYAMDARGLVAAYSMTGDLLWKKETTSDDKKSDTLGGGICFDQDTLIATTSFGDVIAYDKKTGNEKWKASVSSPIRTSGTIAGDKVFVVSFSNELSVLDLKSGVVLWTHQGIAEFSALLGGASPSVKDNTVIVAYSSGEYYALNTENGTVLWTDTLTSALRSDTVTSIAHIKAHPIIDNKRVYVISHGGKMVANDLETGMRLWQKEIGGALDAAIGGDFLFMIDHMNDLIAIEKNTGDTAWSVPLTTLVSVDSETKKHIRFNAPLLVNNQIMVASSSGHILFINPSNGSIEKTMLVDQKLTQMPLVVDKKLVLFSDNATLSLYGE